MSINSLFEQNTAATEVTANARSLAGTAQLTNIASTLAAEALQRLDENVNNPAYNDMWKQSKADHNAMDTLLEKLLGLGSRDLSAASFLLELDDATIDGMLKSQQSKRSRAKSKVMTLDNYQSMMIGALAENIIRIVCDKPKGAVGGARRATLDAYSEEQIQKFIADPELLKKEIRNVQSKKSIAKTKADFDPADERWQALLDAEAQLKAIRDNAVTDTIRDDLQSIIGEIDVTQLKGAEAKELLAKVVELIGR